MTIYISNLKNWYQDAEPPSCILVSTTNNLNDLHAFAQVIGVERFRFQPSCCLGPHYELNAEERLCAIAHGAIKATNQQIQEWRETWIQETIKLLRLCKTEDEINKVEKQRGIIT